MSGLGKYEFRASSRKVQPDRPHAPAPVAVFVGKPGETKQLTGMVRMNDMELEEFKQRLENPVTSTTETQETPIHWAQYDGLSVAITRSEHDGKLLVVLENLLEEGDLDVRITRDSDEQPIWEGAVE